jgi:hypothetical protein
MKSRLACSFLYELADERVKDGSTVKVFVCKGQLYNEEGESLEAFISRSKAGISTASPHLIVLKQEVGLVLKI